MLGVLLGKNDPPLLEAYLQTLNPGLLADVVIANMTRLPAAPPPDDGGGGGGLAGLMQVCRELRHLTVGAVQARCSWWNSVAAFRGVACVMYRSDSEAWQLWHQTMASGSS